MLIPPGSLWGRVVRAGKLSPCPTKKSPFGDMNLNEVRRVGVRGVEEVEADACVCLCVTDGELRSADRACMLPGFQIIFGNL